jgi:hypothetical protein
MPRIFGTRFKGTKFVQIGFDLSIIDKVVKSKYPQWGCILI